MRIDLTEEQKQRQEEILSQARDSEDEENEDLWDGEKPPLEDRIQKAVSKTEAEEDDQEPEDEPEQQPETEPEQEVDPYADIRQQYTPEQIRGFAETTENVSRMQAEAHRRNEEAARLKQEAAAEKAQFDGMMQALRSMDPASRADYMDQILDHENPQTPEQQMPAWAKKLQESVENLANRDREREAQDIRDGLDRLVTDRMGGDAYKIIGDLGESDHVRQRVSQRMLELGMQDRNLTLQNAAPHVQRFLDEELHHYRALEQRFLKRDPKYLAEKVRAEKQHPAGPSAKQSKKAATRPPKGAGPPRLRGIKDKKGWDGVTKAHREFMKRLDQ